MPQGCFSVVYPIGTAKTSKMMDNTMVMLTIKLLKAFYCEHLFISPLHKAKGSLKFLQNTKNIELEVLSKM